MPIWKGEEKQSESMSYGDILKRMGSVEDDLSATQVKLCVPLRVSTTGGDRWGG